MHNVLRWVKILSDSHITFSWDLSSSSGTWTALLMPVMQITTRSKNLFRSLNQTTSSSQAGVKPVALFICICLLYCITARILLSYKSWKLTQYHLILHITYLTIRYTNSPGQKPHIPSSQEECKWPCKKEKQQEPDQWPQQPWTESHSFTLHVPKKA